MALLFNFTSVWVVVFTATEIPSERIQPLFCVATDLGSGRSVEFATPLSQAPRTAPYPLTPRTLIVTINVPRLVGCHLALGWSVPERIVDLMVEWKCITNRRTGSAVGGLSGALLWFGCSPSGALADSGSPDQMRHRLDAVARLFGAMQTSLDLGRALLRGRYLCAVARIEAIGIPVDSEAIAKLGSNWLGIRARVVEIVDRQFGVYRGAQFDKVAFLQWLNRHGVTWPVGLDGRLDLSDGTFRDMARGDTILRPLRDLRTTLDRFNPNALTVGLDGRNRTALRPFASRTSRNQPSAKASVFGSAAWVRHLVRPDHGSGIVVLDWCQQEFGIAAALSGDAAMQAAYRSGDPYLALANTAMAFSADATEAGRANTRVRFKACALGVQYGMGAARLGRQIGVSETEANELLVDHKATYPKFWRWSDSVEVHGILSGELQSVFGWRLAVDAGANPRSLRNFPMQANGAEMLRLACCVATEKGIRVCATLHDAIVIEAPLDRLNEVIHQTRRIMAEASAIVLDGFALRTDVKIIRSPERWREQRGAAVWSAVESIISPDVFPARQRNRSCAPTSTRSISYIS
jgi:DNA polymerase I